MTNHTDHPNTRPAGIRSAARLALSWLTVLPIRADVVDRHTARRAIAISPLVGALLGLLATGVLIVSTRLGAPPLLAGLLVVGLLAVATRGMHVDGLADTADGLGCYGSPERALAVMADGSVGPFGVVTLVITLGAQAASMAALAVSARWWAVTVAVTAGRAAFVLCCRRGYPAARQQGLGALVADSQPLPLPIVWWLALLAVAAVTTGGHWWLGPAAVALAASAVLVLTAHTRRRLGGLTGDVLGAANEVAVTTILVVCTLLPTPT